MYKEFIPYEQALELKELGFDEECIAYWTRGLDGYYIEYKHYTNKHWMFTANDHKDRDKMCTAPLYQQAFRWFREKKILGQICPVDAWNKWGFIISVEDLTAPFNVIYSCIYPEYATYEEAEFALLKKLIEIVKTQ